MSKRTLVDLPSETINNKRQLVNPLSDDVLTEFMNNGSRPIITFTESVITCIKMGIPVDPSIFKQFLLHERANSADHSLSIFLKSSKNDDDIEKMFSWFQTYIANNKNHESIHWATAYIVFLLVHSPRSIMRKYYNKFYLAVDQSFKINDEQLNAAYNKVDFYLVYPYFQLMYQYNPDEEIDVAILKMNEVEFKNLCNKHGNRFIVKAIHHVVFNYYTGVKSWNWRPLLSPELKKDIISEIQNLSNLRNLVRAGFLSVNDAEDVMKLEICKMDYNQSSLYLFTEIFQDSDSLYGKFARSLVGKYPENFYDIFNEGSDYNIHEKDHLIRFVIPINHTFFSRIKTIYDFVSGLNVYQPEFLPALISIINIDYCNRLNVSLQKMRNVIGNYVRKFGRNLDILHSFFSRERSFNMLQDFYFFYFLSDFIYENSSLFFQDSNMYRVYLLACGISGRVMTTTDEQKRQILAYGIDQFRIMAQVINLLQQDGIFIKFTGTIIWSFDGKGICMIPGTTVQVMPNEMFKGFNLVWNKVNTILNKIVSESLSLKHVLDLAEVVNSCTPNFKIEKQVMLVIFDLIEKISFLKTDGILMNDLMRLLNVSNISILLSQLRSNFTVKYNRALILKRNKQRILNMNVRVAKKADKEYLQLLSKKSELPLALSEKEDKILDQEKAKMNFRDCAICFDHSTHFVKLKCKCKYDFCATCIFDMRRRSLDFKIKCPTCRDSSNHTEDTEIYL